MRTRTSARCCGEPRVADQRRGVAVPNRLGYFKMSIVALMAEGTNVIALIAARINIKFS
jgi:hypothetical protein